MTHLSPAEIQARLERILLTVEKPGRYVGGELNAVIKDWGSVETHLALVFPDLYDLGLPNLGLPNLGLAILYDTLNQRSDALAERAIRLGPAWNRPCGSIRSRCTRWRAGAPWRTDILGIQQPEKGP